MTMENVFVVSRVDSSNLITSLTSINNLNIVGVCAGSPKRRNDILERYSYLTVYSDDDITEWNETFVSQKDIEAHYSTQLKVERYGARLTSESSLLIAQYYQSLSFWINIFQNNEIDVLIIDQVEHGSPLDSIPIDLAKEKGITTYLISPQYANKNGTYYSISCCNSGEFINITDIFPDRHMISVEEVLGHKPHYTIRKINQSKLSSTRHPPQIVLIYYIVCGVFGIKRHHVCQGVHYLCNYRKTLSNILSHPALKRYYNKHAVKSISENERYILYALHFEPEASIMNRTIYNNQIYNIQMLSQLLPHGWKIYVKEHPHQYNFRALMAGDFLHTISQYRSKEYYDAIRSIPNVELLSLSTSLESLLRYEKKRANNNERSMIATATINGTIALESLYYNIPTILFDGASTPTALSTKNIVNSEQKLSEILHTIDIQNPSSKDLSNIPDYVFQDTDISELTEIMSALVQRQ